MEQKAIRYLKNLIPPVAMLMLLASIACTSLPTLAPTPEPVPEPSTRPAPSELVPRITIEELLQKMESKSDILIIDNRHKGEYDMDHIKGALSATLSTIVEGGWIPSSDKEAILYCS